MLLCIERVREALLAIAPKESRVLADTVIALNERNGGALGTL
jgi:hypothetical protein